VANRIKGLDGGSIGSGTSSNPIEKIRVTGSVNPAGAESAPVAQADSVHITQSARSLAMLSQAVHDTPDVDAGRVAAAQQAIGSGQYSINPHTIASRLMQLEQDLSSATSK
jgi:flagellar biosynthesis anti-sigma factor FlgM